MVAEGKAGEREDWIGSENGPVLELWLRRAGLALLFALVVAALLNTFGQRTGNSSASGPAASLKLNAPKRVRGGLIFQARFDVRATREVRQPELILDRGWLDGLTQNTSEPGPKEERTDNGRIVLEYDTIPAGDSLVIWLQYQVNPTHLGKTDQDAELWDGETRLVHLDHSLTTFP
jgi:hypothetical protein